MLQRRKNLLSAKKKPKQRTKQLFGPRLESLERRLFLSADPLAHAPYQHVLILSVDGLHNADIVDPMLQQDIPNIQSLQQTGVTYANASTSKPSDSFPGTMAYLTGANPGTTGVFYDVSYDRELYAPGTADPSSATPGTVVAYDESLDRNSALLSGGGNFGAGSIDPANLPVDSQGHVVYPHQFLKVNTIFNVATDAGLNTAFSDKHPAYDIANGPSGNGVQDMYSPEINSTIGWDPNYYGPGQGKLVDASDNIHNISLGDPTKPNNGDNSLVEHYDDLKVQAILNEIDGWNALHTAQVGVPNLFGMNFQAVSVAQKDKLGGIDVINGQEVVSSELNQSLSYTDASIGKIVHELKVQNLYDSTLVVLLAKHGQSPRLNQGTQIADSTIPDALQQAGVPLAAATQDDVSLLWLQNQSQTQTAVNALQALKAEPGNPAGIGDILYGEALKDYKLGDAAKNSRTPDIVVTVVPGTIYVGKVGNAHKRAEHGGFAEDDTHVALILSSGGLNRHLQGTIETDKVETTAVAVTALDALGLDPNLLQGAVIEGTQPLPGSGLHRGPHARAGQERFEDSQAAHDAVFSGLLDTAEQATAHAPSAANIPYVDTKSLASAPTANASAAATFDAIGLSTLRKQLN